VEHGGKPAHLSGKAAPIAEVCRRYGVRELMLFGSALRPDFSAASDLDFLVEFHPGAAIGLVRFIQLKQELESLLRRKVDLVPKRGLKPALRDSVLEHAELLYEG
jgi:predicted nucleotidyltransferase